MMDVEDRVQMLEQKLTSLSKRVEDMELEIDQARSGATFFNQEALERSKEKLARYVQDNPIQSLLIAVIVTAILVLILT